MKPDLTEFLEISELEALRAANHDLERKLRGAKAKTAELVEATYQAARDAAVILGNPPPVQKPKADRRAKDGEVALLLCSDWHFGQESESYNIPVANQRVQLLGEKVEQITRIERAAHPVRDVHVLLNGDMAEGLTVFPGQAFEVSSELFEQMFAAAGATERLLRQMLGIFTTVHVWTQAGNHGRLGKKGDMPRGDNVDRMIYQIVKDRMTGFDLSRLVWHPSDTWYSIVEIGAYRALLMHGDQIKSFGGIPAFAITRKVNQWATGVLPAFTDTLMGHFHSPMVLPIANGRGRTFVNPALASDSPFGREFMALNGTPGQRLHFVSPEHGRITSERVLWLDAV